MNEFTPRKEQIEDREKLVKKILVADDNSEARMLLKIMLAGQGYKVDEVENGNFLLNKLFTGKEKYDLVITDIHMPEINGIEALRRIRADVRFENFPVMVNSTDYDFAKDIKNLGGVFFKKPFDEEEILALVKKVFSDSRE